MYLSLKKMKIINKSVYNGDVLVVDRKHLFMFEAYEIAKINFLWKTFYVYIIKRSLNEKIVKELLFKKGLSIYSEYYAQGSLRKVSFSDVQKGENLNLKGNYSYMFKSSGCVYSTDEVSKLSSNEDYNFDTYLLKRIDLFKYIMGSRKNINIEKL